MYRRSTSESWWWLPARPSRSGAHRAIERGCGEALVLTVLGHDDCALPFPGGFGIEPLLGAFAFDASQKKAYSAAAVALAVAIVWFGADWAARQRSEMRTDAPMIGRAVGARR
jgi:hypothetical protein